jgi:hypothetical protein
MIAGGRAAWVAISVVAAVGIYAWYVRPDDYAGLRARMATLIPLGSAPRQSCQALAARRPLVILALGQSNAGNHGAVEGRSREPITMVAQGQCITAQDPLPGATGQGASIWGRLVARLSSLSPDDGPGRRPVVLAVLAVDSSSIGEWTDDRSALRKRLVQELHLMKQAGLPPALILWQQGEADAMAHQSTGYYAAKLDALAEVLTQSGVTAPVLLARSTRCRSAPSQMIRAAIEAKLAQGGRWLAGPDTDTLSAPIFRHDGCHFSAAGLDAAAELWVKALAQARIQAVSR